MLRHYLIIFIDMNPEISPWMVIADKQRYNDIKREQQEKQLKNLIKLQYQKQLAEQINKHKQLKDKQKQREKQYEKNIINKSIENQQKIIQMEKMKAYLANQKQARLDGENQYYKAIRKQREQFMEEQSKKIENQMHRQADEKHKKQMMQQQNKKKFVLEILKQSIDDKQHRDKYNRRLENAFEDVKLRENQILNQREQQYREDYLRKLKNRALTIDYGSHEAFAKNHQKTLVQRKKQQWQSEHEYIRRAQQLDIYQEEFKKIKHGMEKDYRSELKKQISQKQQNKRFNSRRELQHDQQTIMRSQNYSKSLQLQHKSAQEQNKKHLLDYLQKQVQEKKRQPRQPYFMRDKQVQLNYDLLLNSKGIIPGQTYELDPARKKQLETVAKSISYTPTRMDTNYLAERGKTILH